MTLMANAYLHSSAGLAFKVAAVLHSEEIDVSTLFDSIEVLLASSGCI